LRQAGWRKETLVIALPEVSDHATRQKFGELLNLVASQACERGEKPWAIIASGDMSHRLTPGAPAGFHPRAAEFDRLVSTGVREGRYRDAVAIEEGLRGVAAEDVVESLEVACAATGFQNEGAKFFSYEGPFGVGYMEAVLFDTSPLAEATP
jgi:aromatic ring-opening dioxygenase LigB subunit